MSDLRIIKQHWPIEKSVEQLQNEIYGTRPVKVSEVEQFEKDYIHVLPEIDFK